MITVPPPLPQFETTSVVGDKSLTSTLPTGITGPTRGAEATGSVGGDGEQAESKVMATKKRNTISHMSLAVAAITITVIVYIYVRAYDNVIFHAGTQFHTYFVAERHIPIKDTPM